MKVRDGRERCGREKKREGEKKGGRIQLREGRERCRRENKRENKIKEDH